MALEDRLSNIQVSCQTQRSCGPSDELGRHITAIASHYARLPVQYSIAVKASIGILNLCWQARRRQAAGHFRAEGNDVSLRCQLAQRHVWATLAIKATIHPQQTGTHQDQCHFLNLFFCPTLILLQAMRPSESGRFALCIVAPPHTTVNARANACPHYPFVLEYSSCRPPRLVRLGAVTFWDTGKMLDAVPVLLQALVWPLLGAILILIGRRFLPNWLRRLVALAAALASLAVLWSLRTGSIERVEIFWEPLNLFRMSPSLYPDTLALLVGITLAWLTAATVLGVHGAQPQSTAWHGLVLIALAGCLAITMATNLITLAIASALLDMALIAMAVFEPHDADRVAWRMAVPGIASTLLLIVCALQMGALVGTGSLSAREVPPGILTLVGVAGLLRLLAYPLHPRGLHTPENAAGLLLSAGAGIYLIARIQTIDPGVAGLEWMPTIGGIALLAGGILAWTGADRLARRPVPSALTPPGVPGAEEPGSRPSKREGQQAKDSLQPALARVWSGTAVHQTGLALAFVLLVGNSVPWPLFSLTLALGMIIIWWDGTHTRRASSRPQRFPLTIQNWWAQVRSTIAGRFPTLARYASAFLPALALASLAGIPLTAGARGRWLFYSTLLGKTQSGLLIPVLVADSFLVAGLVLAFSSGLKRAGDRMPSPAALLAMLALAVPLIVLGIAPSVLGLDPMQLPDVSPWGLGFLYVLPWLFGVWLARISDRLAKYFEPVYRLINLNWLFHAMNWLGQRLGGAIYWVGQVGEGQGWFGWILIIMALGIMLLIIR